MVKKPGLANPFTGKQAAAAKGKRAKASSNAKASSPDNGAAMAGQRRLTGAFMFAFVIGSIFIALAWRGQWPFNWAVFPPLAVVSLYISYSWRQAKKSNIWDEAGDSQYYLGFLLTLVALTVSMLDLGTAKENFDQAGLIGRIGVALSTSILGLASRLVITLWNVGGGDEADRASEALNEQVSQFQVSLQSSVAALQSANDAVVANIAAVSNAHVENIGKIFSAEIRGGLETAVSGIESEINKLRNSLASMTKTGQSQAKALKDGAEALATLSERIEQFTNASANLANLTQSSENATKPIDEFATKIAAAADKIEAAAKNFSDRTAGLADATSGYQDAIEALKAATQEFKRQASELIEIFGNFLHRTTTMVSDFANRFGATPGQRSDGDGSHD